MIPCYSLFLEVEIPDPSLEYFIVSQDELDNTEHLLAPPPFGTPAQADTRFGNPFPVEIVEHNTFAWKRYEDGTMDPFPPDGAKGQTHFDAIGGGGNLEPFAGVLNWEGTDNPVYYDTQNNRFLIMLYWWGGERGETIKWGITEREYAGYDFVYFYEEQSPPDTYHECVIAIPDDVGLTETIIRTYFYSNVYEDSVSKGFYVPLPQQDCESGLNTFVLGKSCLDGTIDLLEGWGAAKPDYKWVDVITDTTDIEIQRGFDMKQGVVGTPIAGVLEANILDPYLDGIETQKVAVGQRVRLRAGTEIVFSGVCNLVRSEYDAVSVPTLRIEAVDALGLLNAQMVDKRPHEGYNTRLAEAAYKVDLPIKQAVSTTQLNPTEDPMSALELLVETQDSEGSVVWLDRFGTLYSSNRNWNDDGWRPNNSRFGELPQFTFSNNPAAYVLGNQEICLSQYKQITDTSQVINGITFYNYVEEEEEGIDDNGNPITEKVIVRDTYTFESANSRRLYGDAGVKLTTYLDPAELVGYADYIFLNYDTPKTKVETIQFPLDKWESNFVPPVVSLDIGDKVFVRIDDPLTSHNLTKSTQRVAQIRHRINPTEWLCELDLL